MKLFAVTLLLLTGLSLTTYGQNSFPSSGNVGIGTAQPFSIGSYSVLDIKGKSSSNGGYIRLTNSDATGEARIFNTNDRLLFDVQKVGMYFQWRNASFDEVFRLNQDGSARWNGNQLSYTEIGNNTYGQFIRQYGNDGTSLAWLIRGYSTNGVQTVFNMGGMDVNGTIRAKEVQVKSDIWADYVFRKDYNLASLEEVDAFINKNGHLPGIASETEVKENGIDLGEMNRKLLEKVEELTLYLIQEKASRKELSKHYDERIKVLEQKIELLTNKNMD